jgi:hypothetical protein
MTERIITTWADLQSDLALNFSTLMAVSGPILAAYNIQNLNGTLPHREDIIATLMKTAPALGSEVALLVALDQHDAATTTVREALTRLHSIDPLVFAPEPSRELFARTLIVALGMTDVESAEGMARLHGVDESRRSIYQLRHRMVSEGRSEQIPVENEKVGGGVK